jgi:hypothetical protein
MRIQPPKWYKISAWNFICEGNLDLINQYLPLVARRSR